MISSGTAEVAHGAISSMSEMAVSPAPAASSDHFPFAPEISGTGINASALSSTFLSDVANAGVQLSSDGVEQSRDTMQSLGQFWNFSLSEFSMDLTNLAGDFALRFSDI